MWVVETTTDHIAELAHTMREEDRQEIWHLARATPLKALADGGWYSRYCRTVLLNGRVVCIFGVTSGGDGLGVPWMLASDLLPQIGRAFLRECPAFLAEVSEGFHSLSNVAWAKNEAHVRWLQWLGFTMHRARPMGPDNEPFIPFSKEIPCAFRQQRSPP